ERRVGRVRGVPGRGPERADRVPPGRLPHRRRLGGAARCDGGGWVRPARDRRPVLRPRDGRPDDPGRRRHRPARRHPAARRAVGGRAGHGGRRSGPGHDLLEPDRALRRRRLGARPRRGRRPRDDHPGPHPRRGRRLAGRVRRARAGPDLPRGAVVVGGADRLHHGGDPGLPLRHLDDGRHRGPRHRVVRGADDRRPLPRAHGPADRGRAGRAVGRAGRGDRRLRGRRDRRGGVRHGRRAGRDRSGAGAGRGAGRRCGPRAPARL
ncbi:MAG: Tryptophan synthase alpha chain, partial [uncultured Pseudonocardia sp.]